LNTPKETPELVKILTHVSLVEKRLASAAKTSYIKNSYDVNELEYGGECAERCPKVLACVLKCIENVS
jgi:hypothetical protein